MHELKERDQPQQYGGACVQQSHSVDEHEDKIHNPNTTEKGVEFFILPSPVTLDCDDFLIKVSLNKFLKFLKDGKNFRFILEKINPSKVALIINETDIIFFLPKESRVWPHTSLKINCMGA